MRPEDAPWTIHCDGSAVPNPGRMGLGAVVTGPDGSRHPISITAEGRGCNNEAELRALMAAMQYAGRQGATALLFDEVRAVLHSFASARLVWIPRHRNREADALARAAVGLMPKNPAPAARHRR
jgi:ribonuclease HI